MASLNEPAPDLIMGRWGLADIDPLFIASGSALDLDMVSLTEPAPDLVMAWSAVIRRGRLSRRHASSIDVSSCIADAVLLPYLLPMLIDTWVSASKLR